MASQPKQKHTAQQEQELMATIWSRDIADNPLAFVRFAFPWGQKGTPLEGQSGPRPWQAKWLQRIADKILENKNKKASGLPLDMLQAAIASGRGIGKSAMVAWLTMWMMSCRPGSTTIVTANNEQQLKSRTWAELGRWHAMAINSHWFEKQAMALKPAPWFEERLTSQLKVDCGYYYAQAQLWSEEVPDAFAGVHNHKGVLLIFDEASGIPPAIWKVSKGFFTENVVDRYWLAMSNPRRNTGTFFECFHRNRDIWETENIDARSVTDNDPAVYEQIIKEHGADSDEARVEVYGQFPKQGDKQFISRMLVDDAIERELVVDDGAPLIMGCDIARFGDDTSVMRFRRGRDARSIPAVRWKKMDTVYAAGRIAELINKYNPDAVCVDSGYGGGVIDLLRDMGYKVHEIPFGGKANDDRWANKRTEMWAEMRGWLAQGCIDNHPVLIDDLTAPEYGFMKGGDRVMLEQKEKLKSRGYHSPDDGDALALTFAVKVARNDLRTSRGFRSRNRQASGIDYDLFSY